MRRSFRWIHVVRDRREPVSWLPEGPSPLQACHEELAMIVDHYRSISESTRAA